MVYAVMAWGIRIAAFGLSRALPLALALLAFTGAADVVCAILRQSMIQLSVPDSLRGRLSSIHVAASAGGPRLGDLEAGRIAEVSSVRFSIVSGGVACPIDAVAIARWSPTFFAYCYSPEDQSQPSESSA